MVKVHADVVYAINGRYVPKHIYYKWMSHFMRAMIYNNREEYL